MTQALRHFCNKCIFLVPPPLTFYYKHFHTGKLYRLYCEHSYTCHLDSVKVTNASSVYILPYFSEYKMSHKCVHHHKFSSGKHFKMS